MRSVMRGAVAGVRERGRRTEAGGGPKRERLRLSRSPLALAFPGRVGLSADGGGGRRGRGASLGGRFGEDARPLYTVARLRSVAVGLEREGRGLGTGTYASRTGS